MTTDAPNQCVFDPALNCARQAMYQFSALALADPRTGSWEQLCWPATKRLVTEAAELLRSMSAARPERMAARELPLDRLDPEPLIQRLPDSPSELTTVYEQAFGLLVSGACPPFETEYIQSKLTFQRSQQLADVSGFYRAFGLQPSTANPERHDHITLELEFMASLLGLERQASQGGSEQYTQHAAVCRDAQQKFLSEHLAWWVPAFARLLAHENPGGLYEAVGVLLAALIPAERALLSVPPPSGTARPSLVERPEECDGCALISQ